MKAIAIEFSNYITDKHRHTIDIINRDMFYYHKQKDGFIKTSHFNEFPLWVNHIAGIVPNLQFHVCVDVEDTINMLLAKKDKTTIFFSYLESTSIYIKTIINAVSIKSNLITFVIGTGIGSIVDIQISNNVIVLNSISELSKVFKVKKKYDLKYVEGNEYYIPRIYTTIGCRNNCSFCKKDKHFSLISDKEVIKQILVYDSKLIYIGNKTFGQGKTRELTQLDLIRDHTNRSVRFIVQTTVRHIFDNLSSVERWKEAGVRYVELGIESFCEDTIRALGKNYTMCQLKRVLDILTNKGIKVIFNLMIGIPNETIKHIELNLELLKSITNKYPIYALNLYHYTDYNSIIPRDRDERVIIKSWNVGDESKIYYYFKELSNINLKLLRNE